MNSKQWTRHENKKRERGHVASRRKETNRSWNWPQIKSSYGAQNERMKQGKMKYYVYRWEEDT